MLKKVKTESYCKYFSKNVFDYISLVVTVIAVPSAFFPPAKAFKPFADSALIFMHQDSTYIVNTTKYSILLYY